MGPHGLHWWRWGIMTRVTSLACAGPMSTSFKLRGCCQCSDAASLSSGYWHGGSRRGPTRSLSPLDTGTYAPTAPSFTKGAVFCTYPCSFFCEGTAQLASSESRPGARPGGAKSFNVRVGNLKVTRAPALPPLSDCHCAASAREPAAPGGPALPQSPWPVAAGLQVPGPSSY